MNRLPARSLIFAQTIDCGTNGQPTLFEAFNGFRASLDIERQASNRAKVLQRHLQKTKSQLKNKRRQKEELNYIQRMADLDRHILQLSVIEQEKYIQRQKEDNIRLKNRSKINQHQAKSQLRETNSWMYRSTERKRMQNQRTILIQSQREQTEKEIWAMKQRIREKRRISNILDYYHDKMQQVRTSKQKQISSLKKQSKRQGQRIDHIIQKNARLRLLNQRSTKGQFLKSTYNLNEGVRNEANPEKSQSSLTKLNSFE